MKWNKTKYKDEPTESLDYQYNYIPKRKIAGMKSHRCVTTITYEGYSLRQNYIDNQEFRLKYMQNLDRKISKGVQFGPKF